MKILKIIGIILLVLVLVVVVLGLFAPKTYSVERTVVIDAPKDLVFRHIKYWKNWQEWSPWAAQDTSMKVTVEGQDGQPGSKYVWSGDPDITGTGEMTNTGITENEEITYDLHFMEPWESHSQGYVRLSEVDDSTQVAWGFYGEYPFPWNIMLLFTSMDKMIGPDFERGLDSLKAMVEEKQQKMQGMDIQEIEIGTRQYAAIRLEVEFSEMQSFFKSAYAKISQTVVEQNATILGAPAALYFSWDEQSGVADMAAAMPVNKSVNVDSVTSITVEGSDALLINYYGAYEQLETAHLALDNYMKENNLQLNGPVIEEYMTDPTQEQDSDKWLTNIYYPVQ